MTSFKTEIVATTISYVPLMSLSFFKFADRLLTIISQYRQLLHKVSVIEY